LVFHFHFWARKGKHDRLQTQKSEKGITFEQNHPDLQQVIIKADGTTSRLWRRQLLLGGYFISAGQWPGTWG
jgi:hypothetical protein